MQIHKPTIVFISYIIQNHIYFIENLKSINSSYTLTVKIPLAVSPTLIIQQNSTNNNIFPSENYAVEVFKIKQGFRIL